MWLQAVEALKRSAAAEGSVGGAAEARFRAAVEAVNADIESYNLSVPLARFQRGKKREALLEKELEAARQGSSGSGEDSDGGRGALT